MRLYDDAGSPINSSNPLDCKCNKIIVTSDMGIKVHGHRLYTAISRITYSALFGEIGTAFGVGDNSTTFNLPDFRASAPAGVGTSTGYTANETIALGTKYDDQMQGHWHTVYHHAGEPGGINQGAGAGDGTTLVHTNRAGTIIPDSTNGTPRTGTTTRGKLLGVNFIIKY